MVSVLQNRIRIISIVIENKYLKTLLPEINDESLWYGLKSFWTSECGLILQKNSNGTQRLFAQMIYRQRKQDIIDIIVSKLQHSNQVE